MFGSSPGPHTKVFAALGTEPAWAPGTCRQKDSSSHDNTRRDIVTCVADFILNLMLQGYLLLFFV